MMNVAHEDILELFVEAALLGSGESQVRADVRRVTAARVWTRLDTLAQKQRLRAIKRGLRRARQARAERLHVVPMKDQSVAIHLPPQPGQHVRPCVCGGHLERRQGCARLVHIGPRGCKWKVKAA